MWTDALLGAALAIMTLAPGSWAAMFLLRRAGIAGGWSGAAAVGGAMAGILLGGSVLGALAPQTHIRMIQGGLDQRQALQEQRGEHLREIAAMESTGVSEIAVEELRRRQENERAPLREAVANAERRHQTVLYGAGLVLFALAAFSITARRGRQVRAEANEPIAGAIAAGAGCVLLSGVCAALLAQWTLGGALGTEKAFGVIPGVGNQAALFGVGLGIGSALIGPRARRDVAGRVGAVKRAGVVAMLLGALALVGLTAPTAAILFAASLLAAIGAGPVIGRSLSRPMRRNIGWGAAAMASAPLYAIAIAPLDLGALASGGAGLWIAILIAVIFASDGRMLGAWLGWWTFGADAGRRQAWRRGSAMVNANVGLVQIGVVLCAGFGAAIDPAATSLDPRLIAALATGAILVEISARLRTSVGRWLDGVEAMDADTPGGDR